MFKYSNAHSLRLFIIIQVFVLGAAFLPVAGAENGDLERRSGAVASAAGQKSAGKAGRPGSEDVKQAIPPRQSKPDNANTDDEPTVLQQIQPSIEGSPETKEEDGSQDMVLPEGEAQVRVRISVPHQVRATSAITIYPYPPRPPRMRKMINKIDDRPRSVRNQLMSLGYTQRSSDSKLFPSGGFRWHYILNAATAKSGTHPPTNILTMYPWIHKMVPYVQAEIKRINEIEQDRRIRYASVVKDFEENGDDLENEATQKGLSPVEINLKKGSKNILSGVATVTAGTWYVVAAHKAANLQFFWQIPITVSAGEHSTVQLTQTNALLIEGSW